MSEDNTEAAPAVYWHEGKPRVPDNQLANRLAALTTIGTFAIVVVLTVYLAPRYFALAVLLGVIPAIALGFLSSRLFNRMNDANQKANAAAYRLEREAEAQQRISNARANGDFDEWEKPE